MTYATSKNYSLNKFQDSQKITFVQPLSATAIAAMKVQIESNYRVAFLYEGNEYDYTVTLEGSYVPFTNAMNTLFPKGRSDILIQRANNVG